MLSDAAVSPRWMPYEIVVQFEDRERLESGDMSVLAR
jgi:hypothetical protein